METIQYFIKNAIKVSIDPIIHRSFLNLAYIWEYTNGSVICFIRFLSLLRVGLTLACIRGVGNRKIDNELLKL